MKVVYRPHRRARELLQRADCRSHVLVVHAMAMVCLVDYMSSSNLLARGDKNGSHVVAMPWRTGEPWAIGHEEEALEG